MNAKMKKRSMLSVTMIIGTLMILASGCAMTVPPPNITPHQGALHSKSGSSTILIAGGAAGKGFGNGAGGNARYQYQLNDNLALGASGTFGFNTDESNDDQIHQLFSGRVYGRYYPDFWEYISFGFGVGGGSLRSDLGYLTLDSSLILSVPLFSDVVELYTAAHIAFSHPFGGYMDNIPPYDDDIYLEDTFFGGGSLGFLTHFTDQVAWSVDFSTMFGTAGDSTYFALTSGLQVSIW
ncbi:MAG: hypothetical protein JRJ87_08600 [Deltaproteobacteria bacterium]|nr:hypothetical protein [Deltaproteobacteria bacterium]